MKILSKPRTADFLVLLQYAAGFFCVLLGLTVMTGWIFRIPLIIQLSVEFAPMQFNTALGISLSGVLFLCLASGRRETGPFVTILVFLIGFFTLLQYLLGISFGIDEIFSRYSLSYQTMHLGRMAPTSALSFCLVAVSFFMTQYFKSDRKYIVSGCFGAILVGIGGISFVSYLSGAKSAYIWGMFIPMAMHTALAFTLMGAVFMAEAWRFGTRQAPVLLVVCLGFMFTVHAFFVLRYQQMQNFETRFMADSQERISVFRGLLEIDKHTVESVKAFFDSAKNVEREDFRIFTRRIMRNNSTLFSLDWIPRVLAEERAGFVEQVRRIEGLEDFEILQKNENSETVTAPEGREEYYPVYYAEPFEKNESRLGFDTASDPVRREAMRKAVKTGEMAAALSVTRFDAPENKFNVMVYEPIYRRGKAEDSETWRKANHQGFIVGAFHLGKVLEKTFVLMGFRGIDIVIFDVTDSSSERFLYAYNSSAAERGLPSVSEIQVEYNSEFSYEEVIEVGDKLLRFTCLPSRTYRKAELLWLPWAAAFLLALFVLLTAQYVATILSRDEVIRRTVRERTEELSKLNLVLKDEIAQRSLAEEELRNSRSFLKTMIDNLPVAVFAKSALKKNFGAFELWNKTAEKTFGLQSEKVLGKTDYDFFPKEQADFFREKDTEVFQRRTPTDIPFEPVSTPQGQRYLHTIKVPVFDEYNQPLHLVGISEDITERRKMETALKQSEELFRAAFANSAIGMALVATDGRWIQVNPALSRILGYSEEDFLKTDFQSITYPADLEVDLENVRKLLAGQISFYNMEKRYIRKTGEILWCLLSVSLVKDEKGDPVTFVSQVQDIDARKKAQEEIQQKTAELTRSNKELEEFAYVASHDLQEPLRKIISFTKLLEEKEQKNLDEDAQDYLKRIVGGAMRMRQLIEDLLAYSRVMRKQKPFERLDLNEVIRQVLSDLEMRISETGARIQVKPLHPAMADPSQISQLFLNLIGNAIKFRRKEENPLIEIEGTALNNGFQEIRIKDNGIGFEEKYLERIFVPFQRLHTRTEYAGTGIGLSICQKIIRRHGGEITARSKPGNGAVFIFSLPMA